jgi:hypothetical protein
MIVTHPVICTHATGAEPWHGEHVFTTKPDSAGGYYATATHFGSGKTRPTEDAAIRSLAADNACTVHRVGVDHETARVTLRATVSTIPPRLNGYPVIAAMPGGLIGKQPSWLVVVERHDHSHSRYVTARWWADLGTTWSNGDYCDTLDAAITAAIKRR